MPEKFSGSPDFTLTVEGDTPQRVVKQHFAGFAKKTPIEQIPLQSFFM